MPDGLGIDFSQLGALGQMGGGQSTPVQNPFAIGGPDPIEPSPEGAKALALMQLLLPKSHRFVPIDHDPFAKDPTNAKA